MRCQQCVDSVSSCGMEYTGVTNVDMGGVVLDTVSTVVSGVRGQVGGVDTMYEVSTVCRQLAGWSIQVLRMSTWVVWC